MATAPSRWTSRGVEATGFHKTNENDQTEALMQTFFLSQFLSIDHLSISHSPPPSLSSFLLHINIRAKLSNHVKDNDRLFNNYRKQMDDKILYSLFSVC